MHSTTIYRSCEEFFKLVDELSAEMFSSDEPASTFGTKIETPAAGVDHLRTFGPKVRTGLSTSKIGSGRKREKSIYTWLRNRTSSLDCGVMIDTEEGRHPIHLNKNERVLGHFECLRRGERSWLTKLKNQNYWDHRFGNATFYFAGQSNSKFPETLVLLDIDCKKFGTLAGALAFANYLKERYFPGLFIEVSTNGNGVHAYLVLRKWDYGATIINDLLLHRLQPWLREIMREQGFDVENIEVKGTLPVIEWGSEKLEVLSYKSGTLAKLPRMAEPDGEEKLRNTTVLTVQDLQKLPIQHEDNKRSAHRKTASSPLAGSISGKHISEDELQEVDGQYRLVAESMLEVHALKTSGKTVATVEDLAILLMLLKFFTQNMNPDGSLPVNRWRDMWKAVFEAGDINRCFCPQRFKTLRDHLSSLGLLEWEDENFQIGWYDDDGKYHKGKACKWKASEELMAKLEIPAAVAVPDEREKGRTSFIRTNLIEFFKSIIPLPEDETIRPVLSDPEAPLRLNPDEINRFITPFEAFTGLAA